MKRSVLFLLLAAMMASTVACGSDNGKTTDTGADTTGTATDAATTEELIKPNLPEVDYEGYTFTFYTRANDTDLWVEDGTGSTMDDAVYNRLLKVSEDLNVNFARMEAQDGVGADANTVILAGDDAYDVISCHARYAFNYASDNMALEWKTELPHIDLNAAWWGQDAKDAFTINDKLYMMIGDISYQNIYCTKAMYFNKRILQENDIEFPYQLVLDGKWTFDKFTEMAKQTVRDLNGDSTYTLGDDQFGFATTWWQMPINVLFTSGERIAQKNADGFLELTLNTDKTVEVFDTFFEFMKTEGTELLRQDDSSPADNAFKNGTLAFMEGILASSEGLRDMTDDFGIIPSPKFDESIDHYETGVDAGCSLLVVPITAKDPARTSVILESLAYYGWRDIYPTYYDVVLSVKNARDEESLKMLDIIRDGRIYDIGYFCGTMPFELGSIGYSLSKESNPNFASFYKTHEKKGLRAVRDINEFYED